MRKTPLVLAVCFSLSALTAVADTKYWTGVTNSEWSNLYNWLPYGVPAPTDAVVFNGTGGGGSGTISFLGMITHEGTFAWNAGTLSAHDGSGLIIGTNGVMNINGASYKALTCPLYNAGTISLDGDATLGIDPTGLLVNQPGGVVESHGDNSIIGAIWWWNYGQMDNQGLFLKSGGTNTTVAVPMSNSGTIQATTGTIDINNYSLVPMGAGNGVFDAASNAAVILENFAVNSGAQFTGAGAHRLNGGRLNGGTITNLELIGGAVVLNGTVTFTNTFLTGSTLVSSNGLLGGVLDWTGGAIENADPLVIATDATVRLSGSGLPANWGIVSNAGTIRLLGNVTLQNLGQLVNLPSGVVESQGDNLFTGYIWSWNSGPIINQGLLLKSGGAGTTTLGLQFDNAGDLRAESGNIELQKGSGSGVFTAGAGARITYNGYTALDGAQFLGAGTNAVTGSLALSGTVVSSNLVLAGGTVQVTNAVITGWVDWQAGRLEGGTNSLLVIADQTVVSAAGSGNRVIACVLSNAGTLRLSSNATLSVNPVGRLVNGPGGLVELQSDDSLTGDTWSWNVGVIDNRGLFRKTGGTGTSGVEPPLNNYGTLEVLSGTVAFSKDVTFGPGSLWRFGLSGSASYGRITSATSVVLAGTLDAVLVGGYQPAGGTPFTLVSYPSHTGTFSTLILPTGCKWQTTYGATAFTIGATGDLSGPGYNPGTGFGCTANLPAGGNWLIQFSTNLTYWQSLTNFFSTGSPVHISDPEATNRPYTFYRALAQ